MGEDRKLVKKLAEVMAIIKYIQKTGHNKFHNYRYVTEADVAERVREELSSRHIMLIPNVVDHQWREHTTAKGSREYITTLKMEFTFHDGETGETITFNMVGEGQDSGDKGSYKAMTGAEKYALMKAFLIPTGDDPEADEGTDAKNSSKPPAPIDAKTVAKVRVLVEGTIKMGVAREDIIAALQSKVGQFSDVADMTQEQGSHSVQWLEAWKKAKEDAANVQP